MKFLILILTFAVANARRFGLDPCKTNLQKINGVCGCPDYSTLKEYPADFWISLEPQKWCVCTTACGAGFAADFQQRCACVCQLTQEECGREYNLNPVTCTCVSTSVPPIGPPVTVPTTTA